MPLKPELLKGFQQSPFIGRVREGHGYLLPTSWCQILCSYSCPHRSGCSCKYPTQLLFSVLQVFSFYKWKNVIPLKARALRMGHPVYVSGHRQHSLQKHRVSMTKR